MLFHLQIEKCTDECDEQIFNKKLLDPASICGYTWYWVPGIWYLFVLEQVSDVISPQCQLVSESECETKPGSIKQTSADPSHHLKHFDEPTLPSVN